MTATSKMQFFFAIRRVINSIKGTFGPAHYGRLTVSVHRRVSLEKGEHPMRSPTIVCVVALAALTLVLPVAADDVTGESEILCSTSRVKECFADGGCVEGPPETWNIPRFTRIDLDRMTLTTTEASGKSRSTPIERVEREGNDIALQGAENGKAFSFLLKADTGATSVAIALEGSVLAGFGYCTPLESEQRTGERE